MHHADGVASSAAVDALLASAVITPPSAAIVAKWHLLVMLKINDDDHCDVND